MDHLKGYREIMVAVLTQQIKDYINAVRIVGEPAAIEIEKRKLDVKYGVSTKHKGRFQNVKCTESKAMTRREKKDRLIFTRAYQAGLYIFDETEDSRGYIFSFAMICKVLGLDPERMRMRIRELRSEKITELDALIKEM